MHTLGRDNVARLSKTFFKGAKSCCDTKWESESSEARMAEAVCSQPKNNVERDGILGDRGQQVQL